MSRKFIDSEVVVSEGVMEGTVSGTCAVETEELSLVGLSPGRDPYMEPVWQSGGVDV